MILGEKEQAAAGDGATFDDLFRRAGVRHPDAIALVDPDNRADFTDGAPRRLTYAQADRAISAFAARLRGLGLATDTVVALQLPNTVEAAIAFLGVLRARMIAAPVPLLWRQQEMAEGLGRIGAKVIVSTTRIGDAAHADLAMQVAAELFPIRCVCAFGENVPDGITPLDDVFASDQADALPPEPRPGQAAAHVAAVTFDVGTDGLVPVARSHGELIAGGLAVFLEGGGTPDAALLSTISPSSFAGIASTIVPWLLAGGRLTLHHAFEPKTFVAQCCAQAGGTIVLPGPALAAIAAAGCLDDRDKTIAALWRSPERLNASANWHRDAALVDIASFGEIGLVAGRRSSDGRPALIPCGAIAAPRNSAGAVSAIETFRTGDGMLAMRGTMVPTHAFPPGSERGPEPHLSGDEVGFVESGFGCRLDRDTFTLAVTGLRGGVTAIGGYRFRQSDVDALVAAVDPDATIIALPDALLGQRFGGGAPDVVDTVAKLRANGANPLIAAAFRRRNAA